MIRRVLWPVLLIGAVLVVAPLALQLPGRASSGATMIDDFRPVMQADSVAVTADYYNNVFVPLGQVAPAMSQANVDKFNGYLAGMQAMQAEVPKLVPALAEQLHMTVAQVQQFLAAQFPATARTLSGLPQMTTDFGGLMGVMSKNVGTFAKVPPGLDHYRPLVTTMTANVQNYKDVDSLPSFRLFTWFFVVPGVLLVALAAYGLIADRRQRAAVATRLQPSAGSPA